MPASHYSPWSQRAAKIPQSGLRSSAGFVGVKVVVPGRRAEFGKENAMVKFFACPVVVAPAEPEVPSDAP